MAQWTNDRWVSTYHRVVNPPQAESNRGRLSLPFFLQPNFDAIVQCIPSCCSADRPAKYPPVTSGEWATRVTRPFDPEAAKVTESRNELLEDRARQSRLAKLGNDAPPRSGVVRARRAPGRTGQESREPASSTASRSARISASPVRQETSAARWQKPLAS